MPRGEGPLGLGEGSFSALLAVCIGQNCKITLGQGDLLGQAHMVALLLGLLRGLEGLRQACLVCAEQIRLHSGQGFLHSQFVLCQLFQCQGGVIGRGA